MGAKSRGLPVIAVTSVAQSLASEPTHSTGTRLLDHADVVLDLCTPPGDAMVVLEGVATPVGPGSTIAAVALVNELKVQTAALLQERGALPPVLTSAAVVGPDESRRLFDAAYDEHARRASRALRGTTTEGLAERRRWGAMLVPRRGRRDRIAVAIGATEDAASGRAARPTAQPMFRQALLRRTRSAVVALR